MQQTLLVTGVLDAERFSSRLAGPAVLSWGSPCWCSALASASCFLSLPVTYRSRQAESPSCLRLRCRHPFRCLRAGSGVFGLMPDRVFTRTAQPMFLPTWRSANSRALNTALGTTLTGDAGPSLPSADHTASSSKRASFRARMATLYFTDACGRWRSRRFTPFAGLRIRERPGRYSRGRFPFLFVSPSRLARSLM